MMAKILLPSTTALRTQATYAVAPRSSQAVNDRCIGLYILGRVRLLAGKDQIDGIEARRRLGIAKPPGPVTVSPSNPPPSTPSAPPRPADWESQPTIPPEVSVENHCHSGAEVSREQSPRRACDPRQCPGPGLPHSFPLVWRSATSARHGVRVSGPIPFDHDRLLRGWPTSHALRLCTSRCPRKGRLLRDG